MFYRWQGDSQTAPCCGGRDASLEGPEESSGDSGEVERRESRGRMSGVISRDPRAETCGFMETHYDTTGGLH